MHIRHVLRMLTAMIVAVTMLGAHAVAAEDGWTISGVVLDGRPGHGCIPQSYEGVFLRDEAGSVVGHEMTTSDGSFTLSGIHNGKYDLRIRGGLDSGASPQTITVADSDVTGLVFYLGDQGYRGEHADDPKFDECASAGIGGDEPGNGDGNGGEEPGNGNGDGNGGEEPGDGNGNGGEEPGNGNGDGNGGEEPGNGNGGEEPGNGNGSEEPGDGNGSEESNNGGGTEESGNSNSSGDKIEDTKVSELPVTGSGLESGSISMVTILLTIAVSALLTAGGLSLRLRRG